MRSRCIELLFSVFVFVPCLGVLAQSQTSAQAGTRLAESSFAPLSRDTPEASTGTFSTRVREVNVLFSASDWRGHFVSNLTPGDVRVFDNGHPADAITYFLREENLPLKIAMLIDVSGSVTNVFRGQQKAAVLFFQQTLRPSDIGSLMAFSEDVRVIQDFTPNLTSLTSRIGTLAAGNSATAIYDAVQTSCQKLAKERSSSPSRRALILITDGEDNRSLGNIDDAIATALQSEVVIFALNTHPVPQYTDPTLKKLADSTGGELLHAGRTGELASAFRRVNQQLRSQYLLGYKPPRWDADRSFHRIRVTTHRFGLHVHCRKGYYQAD
jgi:Ca-activated chloride channel homolog